MQNSNKISVDEEYALYPVAEIKELYQMKRKYLQFLKEFKVLQQKQEILQQQLLKRISAVSQKDIDTMADSLKEVHQ